MNVEELLFELHAERRWLETVMAALETASTSPAPTFVRALKRSLGNGRSPKSVLELGSKEKAELLRLARRLERNGAESATGSKVVPFRSGHRAAA